MSNSTPSLSDKDFLIAFGLDYVNCQSIDISHDDDSIIVHLTLSPRAHLCPVCSTSTSKIKGYSLRKIKHSVLHPLPCIIHYRARRYVCPVCAKTFFEHNPFISGNLKVSVATVYNVLKELKRPENTFQSVANTFHMSPSSVSNIFDKHIQVGRLPLSDCICFDEVYAFHSDTSDYVCVLLDYSSKNIIDLLPSRKKRFLSDYFYTIPLDERKRVKYVSFDMWHTYRDITNVMLPNAKCIVDKFHVLQDLHRRVDRVRIDVMHHFNSIINQLKQKKVILKQNQQSLSPEEQDLLQTADINYYLLKKFDYLLYKTKTLDPNAEKRLNRKLNRYLNQYDTYHLILQIDPILKEAIEIKDDIHYFYRHNTYENAESRLNELIITCRTSNVASLQKFSDTLTQWKSEIINSFIKIPSINKKMNNALIENRNKSIKLIKHSSNGYTNWNRFRARVLYSLNDNIHMNQITDT